MSGTTLFGREEELAAVDALVDALPGHGDALLIHGGPGTGKSALLDHAAARARNSGCTVLRAVGVQAESRLPFAGLHQLTRTLTDRLPRLPAAQAKALLGAFGMDERAEGRGEDRGQERTEERRAEHAEERGEEPPPGASAPRFFMIALAVLGLLGEAAAETPVLLVVDDAEWLDPPTLDVLGFLARRLGTEPLGLLLAGREDRTVWPGAAGIRELCLGPLAPVAADALLDARHPALPSGTRRLVAAMSAGNPLALTELPLTLGAGGTSTESAMTPELPLTARLRRAFSSPLADLPSDTRHALLVAATADDASLAEVLAAASAMTGTGIAARALEPAIAAGLVRIDRFRIDFTHPLLRSAVLASALFADRLAAHGALARTLDEQPDRQAWHRAAAGGRPDEAVARQLVRAALGARERGAAAVALTALERATALSESPSGSVARLLDAAELCFELGQADRVSALLQQAESLGPDVRERARVVLLREWLESESDTSTSRIHLLIATAEQAAGAGDPELALRLLRVAAWRCWWSDPGRELRERVVAAAERLPVPELHPDLVCTLAGAAPLEAAATVIDRLRRLEREGGYDALTAATLGNAAIMVNGFDHVSGFARQAADGLRRQGRRGPLTKTLVLLALATVHTVDRETGLPAAAEAARLAEETAQPRWLTGARVAQAQFAALRGDLDTALLAIGEAEGQGLTVVDPSKLAYIQIARGLVALAAGRHAEAFSCVWRVFDPADPAYHPFMQTMAIAELAEAATGDERRATAKAALRQVVTFAGTSEVQMIRVSLGFAHALLADDDEAEERYRAAFDLDMSRAPFVRARLMLAHGTWLRCRRRVMEARTPLRIARDSFAALGVEPWRERASQELRSAGEGSTGPNRTGRDLLTPQEIQIAGLAAQGLSNKEIGRRLSLSPRTIGAHLYRIFPKLGITSRSQLSDELSDELSDDLSTG
ncbi:regulatory protein, luxR family [Streptomyces sp. TLI_053]|uniref:ATP-binding protein n=1 Tax=Streptomyces sp. TLI_053 TaxID=1855352 RepID=UPI00087BBBF2|nr:LuxR family transcriptional regulator [Streptomyces sp. TLI_053]SDS73610.1 regulatory protein, luxR family [Streptomyces sp. TLI_053]